MNKVHAELLDKKVPFKIVTDYNLISKFNTDTNILDLTFVADLNPSTKLLWSVESISDNFTFSFIHKNSEVDVTKGYGTINKMQIELEGDYISTEVSFYLLIKLIDKAVDDYALRYKITLKLIPKLSLINKKANGFLTASILSTINIVNWRVGGFRAFVANIFNIGANSEGITSRLSNFTLQKIIKQFNARGDVDSILAFISNVNLKINFATSLDIGSSITSTLEDILFDLKDVATTIPWITSVTSELVNVMFSIKDVPAYLGLEGITTNIVDSSLGFMSKPEGVVNCLKVSDNYLLDKCYKTYNRDYNLDILRDFYRLWYTINQNNLNLNTDNPILNTSNLSDINSVASLRLDAENMYVTRADYSLTYVNKSFTKEFDIKIDADKLTGTYIILETILLQFDNGANRINTPFTVLYRIGITNGRIFVLIGKTTTITPTTYEASLDSVTGWNQKLLGTTVLNSTSFYHIAFCNVSGTLKLFVNGNEEASSLVVGNSINDAAPIYTILGGGFSSDSSIKVKGYLDYYRFNYGSSLYNTNFTLNQIPNKGTILI